MRNKSVEHYAMADILEYLGKSICKENKSYVVGYKYLFTKESRRLNKELGLYIVNRCGEKMARYKKK